MSKSVDIGTVALSPQLDDLLRRYCAALGLSRAETVRQALSEFLAGRGLVLVEDLPPVRRGRPKKEN